MRLIKGENWIWACAYSNSGRGRGEAGQKSDLGHGNWNRMVRTCHLWENQRDGEVSRGDMKWERWSVTESKIHHTPANPLLIYTEVDSFNTLSFSERPVEPERKCFSTESSSVCPANTWRVRGQNNWLTGPLNRAVKSIPPWKCSQSILALMDGDYSIIIIVKISALYTFSRDNYCLAQFDKIWARNLKRSCTDYTYKTMFAGRE